MKLVKCSAKNFASYTKIDLEFHNQGLILIHGATGSGKSTLLDLVSWALYGLTAKNGNADEVRSWNTPNSLTEVILDVLVGSKEITVTRKRGTSTQNDLYWSDNDGIHRGKNVNETQTMLEQVLQCTSEQYLTGAYFHEFSKTGTFFLSKAKDRRTIFESIADLSLPKILGERTTEEKKSLKKKIKDIETQLHKTESKLEELNKFHAQSLKSIDNWDLKKESKLKELESKSNTFETDKLNKINGIESSLSLFEANRQKKEKVYSEIIVGLELSCQEPTEQAICTECGAVKNEAHREAILEAKSNLDYNKRLLQKSQDEINPHIPALANAKLLTNQYDLQISNLALEENPFLSQLSTAFCDLTATQTNIDNILGNLSSVEHALGLADHLYEASFLLRGELLKNSVQQVQEATNRYLETYFDSELKVTFKLQEDELETEIYKNGNSCVYSQLSKGQRGLLKLTFAVSIMTAASNACGTNFNTLFFDEALDGLDVNLKVKAFRLFEDLALQHENVFVIDHSEELKSMFNTQIQVYIENDVSSVAYDKN